MLNRSNNLDSFDFKSFVKTPLGQELIRSLREDLHDNLIAEAQSADTSEKAYGLLKEASGVIKSIDHLNFLGADVLSKEERGKY